LRERDPRSGDREVADSKNYGSRSKHSRHGEPPG
jgi:hypothetical protein